MEWIFAILMIGGAITGAYLLGRSHGYAEAHRILEMFMYTDDKQ